MNPDDVQIDPDWRAVLSDQFRSSYFDGIVNHLKEAKSEGKIIYPSGKMIFNAFIITKPYQIKVVIIGQDPYHNPHEAMGLSFSVPRNVKIPPSLKNIFKELATDTGFQIPEHGDLTSWANQGVFLLNAFLTVEMNKAGSHKDIGWQLFTDHTIKYISDRRDHIVFLLWGNFAKNKKSLIDHSKHLVLEAAHPSPLAGNAFQGCKHFSKTNEYLKSKSIQPIDWQI